VLWLDDLLRDLKFAARQLLRNPGFACIAIVTVADLCRSRSLWALTGTGLPDVLYQ
jgi:hypothetical protein